MFNALDQARARARSVPGVGTDLARAPDPQRACMHGSPSPSHPRVRLHSNATALHRCLKQ